MPTQAPGTVYGNTWEKRQTEAIELRVVPDPTYQPPFEVNPANPQCYLVSALIVCAWVLLIRAALAFASSAKALKLRRLRLPSLSCARTSARVVSRSDEWSSS